MRDAAPQPLSRDAASDERLALEARARAGSREALEALLVEQARLLHGVCHQLLGPHEARDALQAAMAKIAGSVAQFEPGAGSFRTWAVTVTRNLCRDRLRRRKLERAAFSKDGDEQTQLAPSGVADPERHAIARQRASQLMSSLRTLPEPTRQALILFHVHEASYEEIAQALDVPIGTVMTWLHRGRKHLRQTLEEA